VATLVAIVAPASPAMIGLQRHGNTRLLRSALVAPEFQSCGIGLRLTEQLLERATNDGVEGFVPLTSTASEFVARSFGFCETSRGVFETQLAESSRMEAAAPYV